MKKLLMVWFVVLFGCGSNTTKVEKIALFKPAYDLKINDLLADGFLLGDFPEGRCAVKKFNDTIELKVLVIEESDILLEEIWSIKFSNYTDDKLSAFFANNGTYIATSLCFDPHYIIEVEGEKEVDLEELSFYNFFVIPWASGRYFICQIGEEEDHTALLTITHKYPWYFKDNNNPRLKEVFKE